VYLHQQRAIVAWSDRREQLQERVAGGYGDNRVSENDRPVEKQLHWIDAEDD
jgi:hypothetical protein